MENVVKKGVTIWNLKEKDLRELQKIEQTKLLI